MIIICTKDYRSISIGNIINTRCRGEFVGFTANCDSIAVSNSCTSKINDFGTLGTSSYSSLCYTGICPTSNCKDTGCIRSGCFRCKCLGSCIIIKKGSQIFVICNTGIKCCFVLCSPSIVCSKVNGCRFNFFTVKVTYGCSISSSSSRSCYSGNSSTCCRSGGSDIYVCNVCS